MKNKKKAIEGLKKLFNEDFADCPFDKRVGLFKGILEWANNLKDDEAREIVITALYEADGTRETQMLIGLEKALKRIEGEDK